MDRKFPRDWGILAKLTWQASCWRLVRAISRVIRTQGGGWGIWLDIEDERILLNWSSRFLLFLNWSIVALQYIVSSYCIMKWISYKHIYIFTSLLGLPPFPLGHYRVPKRGPSCTVGGNLNWYSHWEQNGVLKKLKIRLPYNPAIPFLYWTYTHNSKWHI